MVATALVHGDVRLNAFSPERIACPTTRALMGRITAVVSPELAQKFPRERAACIMFELGDGQRLAYLQTTPKGDPELHLTDKELEEKYMELATSVISTARSSDLMEATKSIH